MYAVTTEDQIDARLREWGLVREDDSPLTPAASKNRTLICRAQGDRRVLVKIADGPGNVGVVREGGILERLKPLAERRGCPLGLPHLYAFDRALGLVAVEWIDSAETLHTFHRKSGRFPSTVARKMGKGLAYLHRVTGLDPERFRVRDSFRDESDLLECFLRMRPDFYARLSQAGIDFFSRVQHDAEVVAGLQALSEYQQADEDSCLLHGDLKQANLLRLPGTAPLVFLDWELSFWGDPARDLGFMASDYVLSWFAPERVDESVSHEHLKAFLGELFAAYREGRGKGFGLDASFQRRAVRWIGTAMLFYVYGMTHYEGAFSPRAMGITEYATHMLAAPDRWPAKLWGQGG